MSTSAVIAGTGFEGRDEVIKKHCKNGLKVILGREPNNKYDKNAIAVFIAVPRLFGLLGISKKQIGYIKRSRAKPLSKKIDSGVAVSARIKSFYAPEGREHPRVTIELNY